MVLFLGVFITLTGPRLLSILMAMVDPLIQTLQRATISGSGPQCSEGKGQAKAGLMPIHEATSEETSKMLLWNTGHTQSSVWNMGST